MTRHGAGANTRFTLKHDHRHDDGEADAVTFYGGTSGWAAHGRRFLGRRGQRGAVHARGLDASLTNVWRVAADPAGSKDARFATSLRGATIRPGVSAEFDTTKAVAPRPRPGVGERHGLRLRRG